MNFRSIRNHAALEHINKEICSSSSCCSCCCCCFGYCRRMFVNEYRHLRRRRRRHDLAICKSVQYTHAHTCASVGCFMCGISSFRTLYYLLAMNQRLAAKQPIGHSRRRSRSRSQSQIRCRRRSAKAPSSYC